jgi:hypothetical protein
VSGTEWLKNTLSNIESLLERVRAEYHRDLAERLYHLEDEVLSLRRELRRLSEALEPLLDVLSPRSSRGAYSLRDLIKRGLAPEVTEPSQLTPSRLAPSASMEVKRARPRRKRVLKAEEGRVKLTKEEVLRYLSTEANDTELKVLKLLYEKPDYGSRGSTEIARAIGRVREHTARTLKKLCERGLLLREEDHVPFTYSMPAEVAEAVSAYFSGK